MIDLPTLSSKSRRSEGRACSRRLGASSNSEAEMVFKTNRWSSRKMIRESRGAIPTSRPRLAEPELEESSGLVVRGQVKWFNPNKGYGFVQLSDGSGDAFLHVTALAGIGVSTLQPGETLELRVALGQRGPQVTQIISVDSSTAAPRRPPRKSSRSPLDRQPLEASAQEMGTVKW